MVRFSATGSGSLSSVVAVSLLIETLRDPFTAGWTLEFGQFDDLRIPRDYHPTEARFAAGNGFVLDEMQLLGHFLYGEVDGEVRSIGGELRHVSWRQSSANAKQWSLDPGQWLDIDVMLAAPDALAHLFRGDDSLVAALSGSSTLAGFGGSDILVGGDGSDTLIGGPGADDLRGGRQRDTASYSDATAGVTASLSQRWKNTGDAAGDRYESIENLTGSRFADNLKGDDGSNRIEGGAGADAIAGRKGDDTLAGGGGADLLTGGAGADRFVYVAASDSGRSRSSRDTIADFRRDQGDVIDLAGVDASTRWFANEAFTFIGRKAFSGTLGELRYQKIGSDTYAYGDINGDGGVDFSICLADLSMNLKASDFVL